MYESDTCKIIYTEKKLHCYRRTCIFVHLKQTEPPPQSACHRTGNICIWTVAAFLAGFIPCGSNICMPISGLFV